MMMMMKGSLLDLERKIRILMRSVSKDFLLL